MNLQKLKSKVVQNPRVEQELAGDLAFQVGRQIERARLAANMTQQALAKKVGTHQSSIARAESGAALPSLSFLQKIADALGAHLSAPEFVFGSGKQKVASTIPVAAVWAKAKVAGR